MIILWSSVLAHAAVIQVPSDYTSIQRAIDASVNGDTIVVSPGIYTENINFRAKAITVTSSNPADLLIVSNTVIHASGLRSAVTFANHETSRSVLTGFTITGGYGTVNSAFSTMVYWGGGIYCYLSSPTITGNMIRGNAGPDGSKNVYGYGAAIGCLQSGATITRNLITDNRGYGGGAIMTSSGNPTIANNVIVNNSAVFGGGIVMESGGKLVNNSLIANSASFGGNVYAFSDYTGQCLLTNNIICNAPSGGGVYADSLTQIAFNDVWNNTNEDYLGSARTGLDGNISQDPQFVNPENNDFHLKVSSPCVNAGDPALAPTVGEMDFYGDTRIYARRIDIGASEYSDNVRPLANAGADQIVGVTRLPVLITLDGSGSSDPNNSSLSYRWQQRAGPAAGLGDPGAAKPSIRVAELGTYIFELVVNNGTFDSFADPVQVIVKNDPPTADAGPDQLFSELQQIPSVTLDGSRSFDPENAVLGFRWRQLSGWKVQLSDPTSVTPSFSHPWPGAYVFELIVNDGMQDSQPVTVAVVIGPNHAPIANAGSSRYAATNTVMLDGRGSYDPDGYGTLRYQWSQTSGPAVTLTGTNSATPFVSGFKQNNLIQKCVFQLIVSDGLLSSAPSLVTVTIVRNFGTNALRLVNPPFDPLKPVILAFGGGNCTTGSGMTFGGAWEELANWMTVDSYAPAYTRYADMLIVYLSSVAPDYHRPVQMIGFSTGNLPAMEGAWWINNTYKDARYAANRVSLLDAVCSNPVGMVTQFNTNRVGGEQCWVDNYISNDPNYNAASVIPGTLNVVCKPPRNHGYPVDRYSSSSFEYQDDGFSAFAYLSIIGEGKNFQLNTASNKYYFLVNSNASLVFFNQSLYPGQVLGPVKLNGAGDGDVLSGNSVELGCEAVQNAVRYQLLLGTNVDRVMDFDIISDDASPPRFTIVTLHQPRVWWTIKAFDQFGSSIYADPRLLKQPENRPPVANAGPDLVVYAGIDGKATVILDGSKSTDPDGGTLNLTWAWSVEEHAYLSNAISLTVELPIGVHTLQLMASDGQVSSQPDEVKVTVIAPLECQMKISPSTINLRSNGPHILACIRFPEGFTGIDTDRDEPLLMLPGDLRAVQTWTANDEAHQLSLFGFFDRAALAGVVRSGFAELAVSGKLRSGRVFYARDTIQILEKGN